MCQFYRIKGKICVKKADNVKISKFLTLDMPKHQ